MKSQLLTIQQLASSMLKTLDGKTKARKKPGLSEQAKAKAIQKRERTINR